MFYHHRYRKTIINEINLKGVGLHSGNLCNLKITPAPSGTGIIFNHSSFKTPIEANVKSVVDTSYAVSLGNCNWKVQTVEHLLAALSVLGITDIYLNLDSQELPILDGSAKPFLDALINAGIKEYSDTVEPIIIHNPIWIMDNDKYVIVLPSNEFNISYTINFNHPKIKSQTLTVPMESKFFQNEILGARTFGFLSQVKELQSNGLALGGSMDNAIIFTDEGILNPELRYEDECIRHKILDFVGDLCLLGRPIKGLFIASKAGHALDVALSRKILAVLEADELNRRTDFEENLPINKTKQIVQ
jgi:UDP-3-O-[3-hydroxymyristoyl] N-acetylglucosamine deacetylase